MEERWQGGQDRENKKRERKGLLRRATTTNNDSRVASDCSNESISGSIYTKWEKSRSRNHVSHWLKKKRKEKKNNQISVYEMTGSGSTRARSTRFSLVLFVLSKITRCTAWVAVASWLTTNAAILQRKGQFTAIDRFTRTRLSTRAVTIRRTSESGVFIWYIVPWDHDVENSLEMESGRTSMWDEATKGKAGW